MNWINSLRIGLLLLCIMFLFFSWEFRSVTLLLLFGVVFASIIATLVPSYKNITVPVITTGITLVIGEFSIPYFFHSNQNLVKFDTTTSYAKGGYNDRISGFGYRPTPGVHTSRKLTSDGNIIYDVVYTIGDDGYRQDIRSDNFKAYIYGGSFTFGEGLNDNETLSYYLYQNHGIPTKNVGVHGYGLHQALYNIQQGLTASEDQGINILLTSPWHALRSSCKPQFTGGTPRYEITSEGVQLKGVCDGGSFLQLVLNKSSLISLASSALKNNENLITNTDINLYIAIIREIKKLSDKNKASLLIAYIDATDKQLSHTKWTNESLMAELASIAEVVDVTLSERQEDLDAKYFIHEFDQHPSAIANQQRAKILYPYIK